MPTRMLWISLAAVCTFAIAARAQSTDHGNAQDAHALLDKATAHFRQAGKDQALADFTNDKADYTDRDLYVFCLNQADGLFTAHGATKALVGRDTALLKDPDGKSLHDLLLGAVTVSDDGTANYRWPDPLTKKVEPKTTFMRKLGDQACGVGFYN